MNNTDIIKLAPEQNAKDELKKIVTYAYTALGQKPADQTIEMSADFIYDKVSRDTTLQQVKDVIRQALDTTENRQLNPKWFADVIRTSKTGINRPQDWEDSKAPQSTGHDGLDIKLNLMTMWAVQYYATAYGRQYRVGCNWDTQYRFLIDHNLIAKAEDRDARAYWISRAKEEIKRREINEGSVRDVLDSRHAVESALADSKDITNTIYRLRVQQFITDNILLGEDTFSNKVNAATPELPAAFVMRDDSAASGFYIQYTLNGLTKQLR